MVGMGNTLNSEMHSRQIVVSANRSFDPTTQEPVYCFCTVL